MTDDGPEQVWKPHVTVAAVVESDGRFLVVEETADGERVLNQPAGHLEPGESLTQAVVRETLEETAWHIRPTALIALYRWCKPDDGTTFLRATFAAEPLRHDPRRTLDEGIHQALWLTPEQIRVSHLRSPMVVRSIDDHLAGHRHSLALLQDLATSGDSKAE